MNKHTPAPWGIRHKHYDKCDYMPERETYNACKDGKPLTEKGAEGKANAQLIASAPELLEALESVVLNWAHLNDEHFEGVAGRLKGMCEEAISKARGIK